MLKPLLSEGVLPKFQKLLDEGFYSPLKVTIPSVTIPSWPCLFSGITPYQLGYFWFTHPDKGLFNSSKWRERAIFSIPSIRSFVLNVPGTYPAWKINGEMISGMLSPNLSCYPKELEQKLPANWIIDGKSISETFKALEMKSEYFLEKLDEDFELLVYVIRAPDVLSHHAQEDPQNIRRYIDLAYKKIDDFLGKLMEKDFDNMFIVSDHGLRPYKKEFNVIKWLQKKGLVSINESIKEMLLSLILKLYGLIRPFSNINYLKKYYGKILEFINKNKKLIPKDSNLLRSQNQSSRIRHYSGNVGALFLNDKSERRISIIKSKLEEEERVKKVIEPKFNSFPDLFIVLKENYIFPDKKSSFLTRNRYIISHQERGMFIAYGKDVKRGKSKSTNYFDIAPTIINLYKINKQKGMIGNILDIF